VAELDLDLDAEALLARLLDYSGRIPDFPAAVKEWRWRNGWQLDAARKRGLPLRHTLDWLRRAGVAEHRLQPLC
jgi:hypothetical protein